MSAKIWILLAVVHIARTRDVIVGSNDIGHKIYDENKQAGPAIWRQMENLTITTNDSEVLSKIVITDLRAEKDGDARIVEGGEGQRNVTIELKSPTVLRGYEFRVEAYAVAEDQLKTMGQNSESPEHNILKEEPSTATSNASISPSVISDKQLTSTIIASPANEASINRRQNRDTENKDKSTQDFESTTPSLPKTASKSEASKMPLPNAPTSNAQNPDQKFPIVNREFQQGHTFDHPRINIYEINKVPVSTARTIPSIDEIKPEKNIQSRRPLASGESNKTAETNVDLDKMHTHISYPQFGANGLKPSQESVINTASPLVEVDNNKNVRHRRNVINPIDEKKDEQKHFGVIDTADSTKTTPLNSQGKRHDEEHAVKPGTLVTSDPSSLDNQHRQDIAEKSKPNQHTPIIGRHFHGRFGNAATTHVSLNPSSAEDNTSTPLTKGDESTETAHPSQTRKELSESTSISEVTDPTTKSWSTTENFAKVSLEPKVSNVSNNEKPHEFNVRHIRDTTSVNNKIINKSLLPPVLRSSSTTLNPEVNTKIAKADINTTVTQAMLENSKEPVVNFNNEGISKGTAADLPQSEGEGKHTRDAIDTNPNMVGVKTVRNDKVDTLDSSKKYVLGKHELNEATIKTQESDKVPIELQSKDTEKSLKAASSESKNGENMERKTRDTSLVEDPKNNEKGASTNKPDAAKINNNEHSNLENKFTPASTVDKKVAKQNDKIAHPRDQIPVWNKDDQEEESKIHNSEHEDKKDIQQSPKIANEAKESEASKKSNVGGGLSDISLATNFNIESPEKPTSSQPISKNNKEKVIESSKQ